jgi:hypothetical protein
MDKNIVALVREDTTTVHVKFFPDSWEKGVRQFTPTKSNPEDLDLNRLLDSAPVKTYVYVTNLKLVPGDLAVVMVGYVPKVVEVQSVDEDINIEPNSEIQYKWIAAKVDLTAFDELTEQNRQLESVLRKEYQARTRRQFRDVFLAGASEDVVKQLTSITQKKGA